MTLYEYDKSLGVPLLCGVDEAGRGPLAGDVYAAAVILPNDFEIPGINDSKKLSAAKREKLYDEIIKNAVSFSVGIATVEEIEKLNILNAAFLAMNRAVSALDVKPGLVLVDGNKNPIKGINSRCLVKGDATSACVAAASIIAKVTRDRYMEELDRMYPEYLFAKHKGYGTALHYEMIKKYGVSPVHRKSFLKNLDTKKPGMKQEKSGQLGEKAAAKYLAKQGYKILERNFSTSEGEIDIIAQKDGKTVFIEVKTRGENALYTPSQAVDAKKQERIIKTSFTYLSKNPNAGQPRFDVVEVITEGSKNKVKSINHIEDAFWAEGQYVFF